MPWLKSPVFMIVGSQALFTAGDLLARANMRKGGFTLANFVTFWFVLYFTLRTVAMFGQLYVLSSVPIGKSMALFGATSIALVNVLGVLLLGEVLGARAYAGVSLAVLAFVVMAL
jgi:multidrug transporter EmrE-like cation transporter